MIARAGLVASRGRPATLAVMRRSLLLATLAALLVGLGVTTVSLAGGRDADRSSSSATSSERAAKRTAVRSGHRGLHERLLADLAARLQVTPVQLKAALKGVKRRSLERAVQRGTITAAQRDTLAACLADRRSCERSAVRPIFRRLKADAQPADFVARKRELAEDLAAELGKEPAEVLVAVRAELEAKLALAVTFGAVTAKGRDLALACFDDPASCDVQALRAEVRFRHGHHGRGGRGHR